MGEKEFAAYANEVDPLGIAQQRIVQIEADRDAALEREKRLREYLSGFIDDYDNCTAFPDVLVADLKRLLVETEAK